MIPFAIMVLTLTMSGTGKDLDSVHAEFANQLYVKLEILTDTGLLSIALHPDCSIEFLRPQGGGLVIDGNDDTLAMKSKRTYIAASSMTSDFTRTRRPPELKRTDYNISVRTSDGLYFARIPTQSLVQQSVATKNLIAEFLDIFRILDRRYVEKKKTIPGVQKK